jgi:alcohol-forming fatty acyl-CoA reductase
MNGPIGLLIGAGKGVVRTMLTDRHAYIEDIPVDFATRGIILAAWETANQRFINSIYTLILLNHSLIFFLS